MKNMEGKGEQPPKLTGMDLVVKENLYGNLRLPQAELAILSFTVNALLANKEPHKLIGEYLYASLPEEKALPMLERANRAHAAFLPEGTQPKLVVDTMKVLWSVERDGIKRFFERIFEELASRGSDNASGPVLELLTRVPLPLSTLRPLFAAAVEKLKDPELAPLLEEYRNTFRVRDRSHGLKSQELYKRITGEVVANMRHVVPENGDGTDPKVRNLIIDIFERGSGSEL